MFKPFSRFICHRSSSLGRHVPLAICSRSSLPAICRFNSTDEFISKAEETLKQDEEKEIEKTTGQISNLGSKEAVLYFDNVYPVYPGRLSIFTPIVSRMLGLYNEKKVVDRLSSAALPKELSAKITQLIPRYKDGGAFARIETNNTEINPDEIEACVYSQLKENNHSPIFNPLRRVRVFSVKGIPWIEDLKRLNNNKVRVVFDGDDLSQESLYKVLRRYGLIVNIIPPSPASKDLPRSAIVEYSNLRDACTARNCVNSLLVEGTKIHIEYIPHEPHNIFRKLLTDHPRISIPVLLALLATLTVFIFEPIRAFFVKKKVCGSNLGLERFAIYQWLIRLKTDTINSFKKYLSFSASASTTRFEDLWTERQESVNTLQQWLDENVNTFILVNGPRGSGKKELVNKIALAERTNIMTIDCETLAKARNDSAFIKAASAQLGYYPVFPWMKNLSTFVDLIVQGLTGQKSGFSESNEVQFKSMLNTVATALREVALENYKKTEKQSDIKLTEESYLQLHAEVKPIVVISHFMNKSDAPNQFIYKQLADFASVLVQSNAAHVIFISTETSFDNTLSPALPNQLFKVLDIGDADSQSAKSFVIQQIIEANKTASGVAAENAKDPKLGDFPNIDQALKPLGGRMTDLQTFARRIMSGEQPLSASRDMVKQAASEVLQMFLLKNDENWTREQVWTIIKALANIDSTKTKQKKENSGWFQSKADIEEQPAVLSYSDLICDPSFKSFQQQAAIRALEHDEMIRIINKDGRPCAIKAGKPLYQAAFKALFDDKELTAMMETYLMQNFIVAETEKILKLEQELLSLANIPKRWEISERMAYLASNLGVSQNKIRNYEEKIKECAIVAKEYKASLAHK